MRKHNGIVVVAYKPGQPLSQVEADLDLADLTSALDLTTPMRSTADDEGIACVCNRFDEAADAVNLLIDAGFSADLIQGCSDKWVPYA